MLQHEPEIAGADEAGRGPLAGPLVVAAVILPRGFDCEGLNDSKKLAAPKREALEVRIRAQARWTIEVFSAAEVDRLNPLGASMEGMRRCLVRLGAKRSFVDGNRVPSGLGEDVEAVIEGDGKLACIAAASILAKTERDRLMVAISGSYPGYGFERHFGYPTPFHLEALRRLGPCAEHRKTYAPVREMIEQPALL